MRIQLLSDLHLETETVAVSAAPDAELLVVAGDIDSEPGWPGLARFASWPVPVLFVAGNHEFDGRDVAATWPALRAHCAGLGIRLLEREGVALTDDRGRVIRFLGTTRWCDFDLFGFAGRAKAMRAGAYFMRLMQATNAGIAFDADTVRAEALACRAWLEGELMRPPRDAARTVVVTHFAPSLRSADPRYGAQSATASFCNADDDLVARADLWLHGHLHCAHDYAVPRPAGGVCRVVCNPRGHERRGEAEGFRPELVLEV